ncbi:hypothetical protein [Sulfurimonas sp.]|uniref:hypothetical protein n=1 Tax=Sulfurimonas sp. TaxID=2022749 RepID=UPI003D122712
MEATFLSIAIAVLALVVWIGINSMGDILENESEQNHYIVFSVYIGFGVMSGYISTIFFSTQILVGLFMWINLFLVPIIIFFILQKVFKKSIKMSVYIGSFYFAFSIIRFVLTAKQIVF